MPLAVEQVVDAGDECVASRRPLVGKHREQHGVADCVVGPSLVAPQDAFVLRTKARDRLL